MDIAKLILDLSTIEGLLTPANSAERVPDVDILSAREIAHGQWKLIKTEIQNANKACIGM